MMRMATHTIQEHIPVLRANAEQALSHPTWDIILIFALVASGFFYGIAAGKRRIAATILYTYVALAIALAAPVEKLSFLAGAQKKFFLVSGVFLATFLLLSLLLGSRKKRWGFAPATSWWQVFLLSFLQAGLLIHLLLSFLPEETIAMLAPITRSVFANPQFHAWWLLTPIVVLVLLRRFDSHLEE